MNAWLFAGVLGLSLPAFDGDASEKAWLTDYAQARAQATRTGKPIFLVFR